eukprot:TRINITY_DN15180_c0_g1_i1.p1 TRINITY_DN15180_c0_g1~~TRINITY_DN15180_c0_g1_i1.p1  ORF type:complete len:198 (+),score=35.91 TRINITY_DN15180_c0_g1_i1:237-830(+)
MFFEAELDNVVLCPNDCSFSCAARVLMNHLNGNQCPKRMFQCKACGQQVERGDKGEGVKDHLAKCVERNVRCVCGQDLPLSHQITCDEVSVKCQWCDQTTLKRKDQQPCTMGCAEMMCGTATCRDDHDSNRTVEHVRFLCKKLQMQEGVIADLQQRLQPPRSKPAPPPNPTGGPASPQTRQRSASLSAVTSKFFSSK